MDMSNDERRDFSQRLKQALRLAEYVADSPTQLAREFNLRFAGRPVTIHAVRKWLVGEAIPTQEKLLVLAQWLGVSAQWLRFGGDDAQASSTADKNPQSFAPIEPRDLAILESLQRLDDKQQQIVRTVIRLLVQAQGQK
jgi:transcriptional regulator with XRE-family HTH domain